MSVKLFMNYLKGFSNIISKQETLNSSTNVESYRSHSNRIPSASSYGEAGFAKDLARHQAKIEYLKNYNIGANSKVLDIGCGFASFGYLLLTQILGSDGHYLGVDVSFGRIKRAIDLMKQENLKCQLEVIKDMHDCLKFKGIDWITIFSVFTHIFNEDIANYLLICNQILEKGGRLCFSILDMETAPGLSYLNEMVNRKSHQRFKTEFYNIHSLDYIKALLKYAGFQLLDASFLPPNIQKICIAEKLENKLKLGN
jgi:cyclopropane fatty-acyl-phospholipid synthase-like methyltransferase